MVSCKNSSFYKFFPSQIKFCGGVLNSYKRSSNSRSSTLIISDQLHDNLHFDLAEEVQLSKRLVKAELTKVASKVLDKVDPLQAKLSEEYPSSIYKEISNGIKLRASRFTNL